MNSDISRVVGSCFYSFSIANKVTDSLPPFFFFLSSTLYFEQTVCIVAYREVNSVKCIEIEKNKVKRHTLVDRKKK